MNNKFYEHRQLIKSFYATYSVGFFTFFLISSMMIYSPVILEILLITKQELAFAVTFFGLFIIISNLLASRFLIHKIGTTNCLKISRLIICFIPLSVFYFENYFFLLISYSFLGIGMGIQAPCVLTQVTIIEKKTNKILTPILKNILGFWIYDCCYIIKHYNRIKCKSHILFFHFRNNCDYRINNYSYLGIR
mgnify:CR=1 FL=1